LNKSEALALLHEVNEALKNSAVVNCISLDGSQVSHVFTGGYQIRMKCELDSDSRDIIKVIVKRNNLAMKEENGFVILNSHE
jgi:hypothetical protein